MRRAAAVLGATVLLAGCAGRDRAPDPAYAFGFQPLWPYRTVQDAAAADGKAADAAATALRFTREFLGFTDLDRTTTATVEDREAWVGVGQADPRGQPITVATLHLARFGPAGDAPWEVVGSEDTDLTIDTPPYGSPVRPVVTVGGVISGVDESLHVRALQIGGQVGEFCCAPAGGEHSRWSVSLPIADPEPGAVTVVVSTGGHYANIERFAITALAGP